MSEYTEQEVADELTPWEPITFAVGDRVRVRLSAECDASGNDQVGAQLLGHRFSGHRPQEDGREGEVLQVDPWGTHRYLVRYDQPFIADGLRVLRTTYAGAELELLRRTDDTRALFSRVRACRQCGCTDDNCQRCVERTGQPCHWIELDLCSACHDRRRERS